MRMAATHKYETFSHFPQLNPAKIRYGLLDKDCVD
jgi:hypothetical protein